MEGLKTAGGRSSQAKTSIICLVLVVGSFIIGFSYHQVSSIAHADHQQAHMSRLCAFIHCEPSQHKLAKDTIIQAPSGAKFSLLEATANLTTRSCGSPAVDGYAHVNPACLEASPTAIWWKRYIESGGSYDDFVIHTEFQSDYDGLAVYWGIGNNKSTAEECGQQCKNHRPGKVDGVMKKLPCNAFAWCPEDTCFEPDAHKHSKGDCWLKFTEAPASPEVNMRGQLPDNYRKRHPNAPPSVQWASGVLLPPGVRLTNGTWSPRWSW